MKGAAGGAALALDLADGAQGVDLLDLDILEDGLKRELDFGLVGALVHFKHIALVRDALVGRFGQNGAQDDVMGIFHA